MESARPGIKLGGLRNGLDDQRRQVVYIDRAQSAVCGSRLSPPTVKNRLFPWRGFTRSGLAMVT